MAVAAQGLRDVGYRVEVVDLYTEKWAPTLTREEFEPVDGHFKPQAEQQRSVEDGTLETSVQAHLEEVLAADLLVLSFPLWWFSLPAILKGWIDRVFVMGAVFGGDHGLFDNAALAGKRAMLLLTTGGPAESFQPDGTFGSLDSFLFHIRRGMLEFVGYRVLEPVVTYGPARMGDQDRSAALAKVKASVTQQSALSPVPSGCV